MADAAQVAGAASSKDPTVGLAAVRSLRVLVERLEALQVQNARDQGWTWEQIAQLLGVSRQAVHKKYASGRGPLRRKD
ncbi:helix-turn-helix domain-containing protein [Blastococcus sp. SYSU DS0619]